MKIMAQGQVPVEREATLDSGSIEQKAIRKRGLGGDPLLLYV